MPYEGEFAGYRRCTALSTLSGEQLLRRARVFQRQGPRQRFKPSVPPTPEDPFQPEFIVANRRNNAERDVRNGYQEPKSDTAPCKCPANYVRIDRL